MRSLQRQCPQSREITQKKCSSPRSSEARDTQDNSNALKQTTPGTEIRGNLETCKNLAFEWGVRTTSPTSSFPLLEQENWRSELWCVNNSHPFWQPAFQIAFQNKETSVFLVFYLLCYQQAFKAAASLLAGQMIHRKDWESQSRQSCFWALTRLGNREKDCQKL